MGTIIAPSRFRNARCAEFNGVDEYMVRTGSLSFRSDTAGAWSMWIRLDALFTSAGQQMTLAFTPVTSGQDRMTFGPRRIAATDTGTYFSIVSIVGGATVGYSGTTTALTAGVWHHIVVQSNGSAWSMYVDGVAQTLTRWSGSGSNTGDWFGDHSGTGGQFMLSGQINGSVLSNFFDGRLDEYLYLPGRALTAGEVTAIYNSGTPSNPHKLSFGSEVAAWWRFGDSRDSATTMYDEIGSNDLTLVNMDASNYVTP